MYLVKCVVFVITVFNPTSALKDVVTESDILAYEFFPVSSSYVQFKVKASTDVHIALTTHAYESNPMYELVIGGWSNVQSVIRRKTCFRDDRVEIRTPKIVNADELRGFWIRWDGGNILVGREGEESAFMSWRDPKPLPVAFVGVHTGFGSAGEWEIDSLLDSAGSKAVQTPQHELVYQFFPSSSNSVNFKVRANNDAHIALSPEPQEIDPMYEIVLGGWGNSKSVIRRRACFRRDKLEVETSLYLNENEYRGFWMRWDHGRILVGREGEAKPFMFWHDLDPIDNVAFVGVHTGAGSTGTWTLMDAHRSTVADEVATGEEAVYQFFPISGTSLQFKVKARNDAHIGLSWLSWESDPMYEILIGGWGNTKSVIRKRCCLPGERQVVQTPKILDDKGLRAYWLSWAEGNLMAGREGETTPFLNWQDPDPFPINYLGVHTGFGARGIWQIGNISSLSDVAQTDVATVATMRPATPAPVKCAPTLTRLRYGTACAGQIVFEDKFDTLRQNIWRVQQYVPIDHPELPFVSYQRFTVSVKDGYLRIIPYLQQYQPGFTFYSLYDSLDLNNGCTSGQSSSCYVEASDGSSIVPPVVSGRITTKSSFAFTYGTITIRAKLPLGDWIYPEILLEPLTDKFTFGTKNSGMLKIACARGNRDLKKGSTHYGNKVLYSGPVIDTTCPDAFLVTKNSDKLWGDDFHVYSVKWTPERLVMSVDGEEYGRVEPAGGLRARLPSACSGHQQQQGTAPFDDHFYITLGLAVGGHSEFSDASVSQDGRAKPWKNQGSKATLNFWNNIGAWYETWEQPRLLVDYVKVVAL